MKDPRDMKVTVLIAIWLTTIGFGFAQLWWYGAEPGPRVQVPHRIDVNGQVRADAPHLMLFLHPKCPCSRATVRQLERVLALHGRDMTCDVHFGVPDGEPVEWGRTDIIESVEQIPGVVTHADPGGRLAERFGVRTSGHVLLYDGERLVFSGGITPARGHEGACAGLESIDSFFRADPIVARETDVFGCPLVLPNDGSGASEESPDEAIESDGDASVR